MNYNRPFRSRRFSVKTEHPLDFNAVQQKANELAPIYLDISSDTPFTLKFVDHRCEGQFLLCIFEAEVQLWTQMHQQNFTGTVNIVVVTAPQSFR
jgi:hypothetical protein